MAKPGRYPSCNSLLRSVKNSQVPVCPRYTAIDPLDLSEGWLDGELGRASKDRERDSNDPPA